MVGGLAGLAFADFGGVVLFGAAVSSAGFAVSATGFGSAIAGGFSTIGSAMVAAEPG